MLRLTLLITLNPAITIDGIIAQASKHTWPVYLCRQVFHACRWMGLTTVNRRFLAAMSFMQYICDQMLLIEWLERRKYPWCIAPGSQQRWMETSVRLLYIIRLLSQPALDVSATFITCLPRGFALRMRVSSSALAHTRLYFLECDKLFFRIIFERSLQSISSFGRIDMIYSL
jgi:hypothetical protein